MLIKGLNMLRLGGWKRKAIACFFVYFILYIIYQIQKSHESDMICFMDTEQVASESSTDSSVVSQLKLLKDVLLTDPKPVPGRSIFFHETSCHNTEIAKHKNILELNSRQACAIESAALHNPNYQIYVLIASQVYRYHHNHSNGDSNSKPSQQPQSIIDALFTYKNVRFRRLNLWRYAAGTPIEEWLNDGKLFKSKFKFSHISDFLRFLTLYRFGGIYLDMDVVVLRSLEDIPPNYTGAESYTSLAAGVMSLAPTGFGHEIAGLALRNFQHNFDGSDWGNNGPGVITRVAQEICGTRDITQMIEDPKRCGNFKIFNRTAFYAVPWKKWNHFFEPEFLEQTLELTRNSYVAHFWNFHSKPEKVKVGSSVAYAKYAEKNCPKVYAASGEYF